MSSFSIVGFWKFHSNKVRLEDGSWMTERLYGGAMAFSASHDVCLFIRSDQGPWGYTGKYQMTGDKLSVQIESSIAEDLEGGPLDRQVRVVNENEFFLSGVEVHTGRLFETHCYRV